MSGGPTHGDDEILDLERIVALLMERRKRLAGELERLTEPPEQGAGIGFGKRVGDGTSEAVERISTTATARSIAASIGEIDIALERFEKGKYGVCEVCDEPIPAERLEARPATTTCLRCAASGQRSSFR